MFPGTVVQAWLPQQGSDARPIANFVVWADGTFTGALPFDGREDDRPLPIGRHVLQLTGINADGQTAVLELTVTITQPGPAPEPERQVGAPPTVRRGELIATNAGRPTFVEIIPLPGDRQARIQGSGWSMGVAIPSADGRVSETPDGGAVIELVRDDVAQISGDGFLPGTRADVWLFSTPVLLGSLTVAADGTFTGEVAVDGALIAAGDHTLQLQGVGSDGYVRAANVGVIVIDRPSDAPDTSTVSSTVDWAALEPVEWRIVTASAAPDSGNNIGLLTTLTVALSVALSGWWLAARRRRDDDELEDDEAWRDPLLS
jgi:hypothetical protein